MCFALSSERPIYYERSGQGPAVVFIHGAGSNAATWWQQLPAFRRKFTCIAMDVRCFGRSVAPIEEFSLDVFAQDVVAILDQEKIERAAIIGQSLGGMIGLKLALDHSHRVACFVACDSSLAVDHAAILAAVRNRLVSARTQSIEDRSLSQSFRHKSPELATLYAQINRFNPSSHSIPEPDWNAALKSLLGESALIPTHRLAELQMPILFVVGAQDPVVPPATLRQVSALVENSEFFEIPDAGHSAYFERAEDFNRLVLEFLRRLSVEGAPRPAAAVSRAMAEVVPDR